MCNSDGDAPEEGYQSQASLQPGTLSQVATSSGKPVTIPGAPSNGDNIQGRLVIEDFVVSFDGYAYKHGKIAYVQGRAPSPLVLVHPNYAGCKQFDVDQAAFLARVGYVGVALDFYKENPDYTFADRNPDKAIAPVGTPNSLSKRHYRGAFNTMNDLLKRPKFLRALIAANLEKARQHPAAHKEYAASIGYCFGGQTILEQVRAGHKIQGVVSFHGLLQSYPLVNLFTSGQRRMTEEEYRSQVDTAPNNYNSQCKVLIENGDLDDHVPQSALDFWKKEMDEQNIDWRFNNHAQTPHGFALAPGVWSSRYVEAADRRSTLSMLSFFAELWPEFPQYEVECNACGTMLGQSITVKTRNSRL